MIPLKRNGLYFFMGIIIFKILLLRSYIFSDSPYFPGLLYDLVTIILFLSVIEFFLYTRSFIVLFLVDIVMSTFSLSTVMYYNHFGRLLDHHAIMQAAVLKDLGSSISDLFSFMYLLFFLDIFVLLLLLILQKSKPKSIISYFGHRKKYLIAGVLCLFLTFLSIANYPTKQNTMAFAKDAGIINAELYSVFSSLHKDAETHSPRNPDQIIINQIKQIKPVSWPRYFGIASDKNIIIVQLESTENFLVGLTVGGQEITPNLNKLIKESMYFPYFFSQVGQGNTSDAEFICNTSIYPLANGVVSRSYIGIEYPSLPRILKKQGYTSMTFHPNDITFWNRDNLYPCLGFDKVYEKHFYRNEDQVGAWGSSDEIIFKRALPILKQNLDKGTKFYASLITLTNHHSYRIPDRKKKITLPSSLTGTYIGNYLTSVNYQDYALGLFIQDLKEYGLWDNSLLIVYGDHFGISKNQEVPNQPFFMQILKREHDIIDRLNVPLIIRAPGVKPQVINHVGGQVDLLPTIANLMGISLDNQLVFGQDIISQRKNFLGFRFYNPEGTFILSNVFHLAGDKQNINIIDRQAVKSDEALSQAEERILALMNLSDQYLEFLKGKPIK